MKEIDELVLMSADDFKLLYAERYAPRKGWIKLVFVLAAFLVYTIFFVYGRMPFMQIVVSLLALGLVYLGIRLIRSPRENKDIALDIKEGYKRRIVAPIESKESFDVSPDVYDVNDMSQKGVALEFAYNMTVKEMKFSIKENFYLAGPKKGEFVEIFIAPHSNMVLSAPTEIQK